MDICEALAYVHALKETFRNKKEKYDEFLEIMKDFKAERIDHMVVVARMKKLLEGHVHLILWFNTFLPKKYEITHEQLLTVTEADAFEYINNMKNTFCNEMEKYDEFLAIMKDFKAKRIDHIGVVARMKKLLEGHGNLILGFNRFLPKKYEITLPLEDDDGPTEADAFEYIEKVKNRFCNEMEKYDEYLKIMKDFRADRIDVAGVVAGLKKLFEGHEDLILGFNKFLP